MCSFYMQNSDIDVKKKFKEILVSHSFQLKAHIIILLMGMFKKLSR